MSNRYKGGVISATPPTTTGGEDGVASGAWTLEQQMQLQAAGLWPAQPTGPYIEQVFSTYLYTGNGGTQTITNGINLSGKGGLVWVKERSPNTADNNLVDTVRGVTSLLFSNLTNAAQIGGSPLNSFGSTGFVTNANGNSTNSLYATWTFREQPKFFDIVTWTGSNDSGTSIGQGIVPHNLGSAPGCVIIKNVTQSATNWIVYHRSLSGGYRMLLNTTDAQTNSSPTSYFAKYVSGVGWTQTNPDANNIYVGNNYQTNGNTDTLVAYIFAHDAGGFGATGTDNVISCGTFTTDGSGNATVSLGYEPQFIIEKSISSTDDWKMYDNMRNLGAPPYDNYAKLLFPNLSNAEQNGLMNITSTGFIHQVNNANTDYIYIAIRRGPMKVPTVGTSVFTPVLRTGTGAAATVTGYGFPPDFVISQERNNYAGLGATWFDRLRGASPRLFSWGTNAEQANTNSITSYNMDGISVGTDSGGTINSNTNPYVYWNFRRAPSFFDEVCTTGNGSYGYQSHNLTVQPELYIQKQRNGTRAWTVVTSAAGGKSGSLNTIDALSTDTFISLYTTATQFIPYWDSSGETYVNYFFATCPGVSKVGTYTGTGTLTTINCGFTGGARFVLIKKSSGVGSWFVWDTARGMVSGTDPSLRLNLTDAEVNGNSIYSVATGFQLLASPVENINTNGDVYIFLAIA